MTHDVIDDYPEYMERVKPDINHISLRDYFAGQALAALIQHYGNKAETAAAIYSYAFADAMLKARGES